MPAKKKKGKKGKKGKEEPEPEDQYMTMKGEELEINITNLKEKLQDMKIRRNYLQIEKDMIHDFYHNTREEIKELEARVINYDTKMQDAEAKHRTDIVSHMQKVKHLEYEHKNSCGTVKQDADKDMKHEKSHHTDNEKANLDDKGQRKSEYVISEKSNIADIQEKEEDLQRKVEDLQSELEF
jgi:growth arrest-specific protein 8